MRRVTELVGGGADADAEDVDEPPQVLLSNIIVRGACRHEGKVVI